MSQKILVLGGTHGNETTGIELVKFLQAHELLGIIGKIANPEAVSQNVRFIQTDLNRSAGQVDPQTHEQKLAQSLEAEIKSADLVIEFHNTTAEDNTCAIITTEPHRLHIALANLFGLKKILIMPAEGSLSGYNSNKFISLEISNSNPLATNINGLYYCLQQLQNLQEFNAGNFQSKIDIYEYTGMKISKAKCKELEIDLSKLQNFVQLSKKFLTSLDLPLEEHFVPIFMGEEAYGKEFGFQVARFIWDNDLLKFSSFCYIYVVIK